jgi:hypothetical protein
MDGTPTMRPWTTGSIQPRSSPASRAPFSPGIVARMNDLKIEVVKVLGEFVWHKHYDRDASSLSSRAG